jgi:hypothetical protein
MLGYEAEDIDRMKFALNMASFYLPPAQEDIKKRLEEVHEFLDGILEEGHI